MDSSRRISLATRTHSHAKTELIYLNDAVQCVRRHWKCLYNLSTATIDLVLVTQQSQCHLVDCEGTVQHVATKCRSRGPTIQKASTAEAQLDELNEQFQLKCSRLVLYGPFDRRAVSARSSRLLLSGPSDPR